MDRSVPPVHRALEEHASFVRSIASALVRDPHDADDLAQEAYVQAIEHPPRHPANLRGWLATIAERLAGRARRAAIRRTRREEIAARDERVSSVVEAVEHRELLRRVTDAVLALEEPYQSTLLQRYYEGLDARAIAERTGVPEATVRSRLQRAHSMLRARLDSEWKGGRAVWGVALARWLDPRNVSIAASGASIPVGGILFMSTAAKVSMTVAASALLALLGWRVLELVLPDSRSADGDQHALAPEPAAMQEDSSGTTTEESPPARESLVPINETTPRAELGNFEVRVTYARDGRLAIDEPLRAILWRHSAGDRRREGRTDREGLFRLENLRPGSVGVSTARGAYDSRAVIAGETTRMELQIQPGFRIDGHVVDAEGKPVAHARLWLSEYFNHTNGFIVGQTAADGSFEIEEVPEARYVGAIADGFAPSHLHLLTDYQRPDRIGQDVELTLRLNGAGGRLALELVDRVGNPVMGAFVRVSGMLPPPIETADRRWLRSIPTFDAWSDARGLVHIDGLPPGPAQIRTWAAGMGIHQVGVRIEAGSTARQRILLEPECIVRGKVLTATGAPAGGASVALDVDYDPSMPRTEVGSDGAYELSSLPAGKTALTAGNGDLGRAKTELRLVAGEIVEWNPTLDAGRVIEGRVVDADDRPLTGWWVEAKPIGEISATKQARTDAEGRFRLLNVESESIDVFLYRDVHTETFATQRRRLGIAENELLFRVDLENLADAALAGRVVDARGEPAVSADVHLESGLDDVRPLYRVDASGAFRIEHLTPGRYEVSLRGSDHGGRRIGSVEIVSGETLDLGTLVLEEAGHVLLTVAGQPASTSSAYRYFAFRELGGDRVVFGEHYERAQAPEDIALPPGRYRLRAGSESGHADALKTFELRPGERIAIDLRPEPGRRVTITLGFASGEESRVDARLVVQDERGATWVDDSSSVGPHTAWPLGLPAGRYTLEARTEDGRNARQTFDVALDTDSPLSVHAVLE